MASAEASTPVLGPAAASAFDLMRLPGMGGLLRWRHARTALQIPVLLLAVVMTLHGLLGPALASKNLATTLTWVHFRGLLALVILGAGNLFCLSCPLVLVRDIGRRFHVPRLDWPRPLRNKWPAIALLVAFLFVYELFDIWSSPWWTAWLIVFYFLMALVVDVLFKHAAWCKFLCPVGQFNFAASLLAPLEVKVRDGNVCTTCLTRDCIRGRRSSHGSGVIQRGCELALFQPLKSGNMDCTFCLDCIHACPHDNVGIRGQLPGRDLLDDPVRSGIGRFSKRRDLAALSMVFTFGALLNAFGMVSPAYAAEEWLARLLHVGHEAPVLAAVFGVFLVVEPLLLLGLAAWSSRAWGGIRGGLLPIAVRFSYSLVPLGFGLWVAHYGFHFFTGFLTIVPVAQGAARSLGWNFLGHPRWALTGIPARFVLPMELGFIALGFAGSLLVAWGLAREEGGGRPLGAFAPWAVVSLLIALASVWLMMQPMEMRAVTWLG